MAIIGTYSVAGPSASITLSNEFDNKDSLLLKLIDNNQNLILAKDVRDAVLTLWRRIEDQNIVTFTNNNETLIDVGGISQGVSFSSVDMQNMWNQLLYPYIRPELELSISQEERLFGDNSTLIIDWTIVKKSSSIVSINFSSSSGSSVNPNNVIPTGDTQIGIIQAIGTHSISNNINIEEVNTFSISVSDGQTSTTQSISSLWKNNIYWGSINLNNINLTYNPSEISNAAILADNLTIRNLPNRKLSTTINMYYDNLNGNGNHLIFAWPSNLEGALNPEFYVNGVLSNSFTRIRALSPFTNVWGYVTTYEVWVSNTIQNSDLDIEINVKV
jgi:hypothetical protein